jgi:hypothetical protein
VATVLNGRVLRCFDSIVIVNVHVNELEPSPGTSSAPGLDARCREPVTHVINRTAVKEGTVTSSTTSMPRRVRRVRVRAERGRPNPKTLHAYGIRGVDAAGATVLLLALFPRGWTQTPMCPIPDQTRTHADEWAQAYLGTLPRRSVIDPAFVEAARLPWTAARPSSTPAGIGSTSLLCARRCPPGTAPGGGSW